MKKRYIINVLFMLLMIGNLHSQTNWGASYQLQNGYVGGVTSTIDKSGNVINAGYSNGNCDFLYGSGVYTVGPASQGNNFITKTDAGGNIIFAKTIELPTPGYDTYICSMTTDQNKNIYLTGTFQYMIDADPGTGTSNITSAGGYDAFVIKLDSNGLFVWSHSYGNSSSFDKGVKIMCDYQNNICLLSQVYGVNDFDFSSSTYTVSSAGGGIGLVFSKYDVNGNFIYAKALEGSISDFTIDNSNNYYLAGVFTGTIDADPSLNGVCTLTTNSGGSGFVQKLNALGSFLWAKNFDGGASFDNVSVKRIDVDNSGNVYCAGTFSYSVDFDPNNTQTYYLTTSAIGNPDPYVLKLTSMGNFAWARQIKGPNTEIVYGMQVVGQNVLAVGQFTDNMNFDPGVSDQNFPNAYNRTYINRYDLNGNYLETGFVKGPFIYVDNEIVKYSSNEFVMTGPFQDTLKTMFPDSNNVILISDPNYSSHFLLKMKLSVITSVKENPGECLFYVYPNPATDCIKIISAKALEGAIINQLGETVMKIQLRERENVIFIDGLNNGIYFLRLEVSLRRTACFRCKIHYI